MITYRVITGGGPILAHLADIAPPRLE